MDEICLPGGYSVQERQGAAGGPPFHVFGQDQSALVVRNVGKHSHSPAVCPEVGRGSQRLTSWQEPCCFPGSPSSFPLPLLSFCLSTPSLPPTTLPPCEYLTHVQEERITSWTPSAHRPARKHTNTLILLHQQQWIRRCVYRRMQRVDWLLSSCHSLLGFTPIPILTDSFDRNKTFARQYLF